MLCPSLFYPIPNDSLLATYRDARAYTDGYSLELPRDVTLAQYIEAFYTTPLFKAERLILTFLVNKPSSDAQALSLAQGDTKRFAAWTVEARTADQILMCDFMRKTRSWLKVEPLPRGTRLIFGSAIVPERISADGRVWLGFGFHALLWFHRLYSKALLRAAAKRLLSQTL